MASKRIPLDIDHLVGQYEAGVSVKALAAQLGVSRPVIVRRLSELGITPRGRSDSMFLRMAQSTPEERMRLTQAAHAATRGRPQPEDRCIRQAQGRERTKSHAGPDAVTLAELLNARGLPVTLEKACGPYNIDLTLDAAAIAVEIQGGNWHAYGRHGARLGKRREHILGAGWHLVEVWGTSEILRKNLGIIADKLTAFAEEFGGLDSSRRQHRVLRGNGEDAPILKTYGYNVPAVETAETRSYRPWRNASAT
jgi:very-short-patch-repair endonuclease